MESPRNTSTISIIKTVKKWVVGGKKSDGYSDILASADRVKDMNDASHDDASPPEKNIPPLFKDLAKRYLTWAFANKETAKADEGYYRNHLAARFDDKRIDEITPEDLEALKEDLKKRPYAPQSVLLILGLVRQMYNKARDFRIYTGTNPVSGVKKPNPKNKSERYLTRKEATKLRNALGKKSELVRDMAEVALQCGLRFKEITKLKGQDLDFENDRFHIFDSKNDSRTAFMTKAVKSIFKKRKPDKPSDYVFKNSRSSGRITSIPTYGRVVKALRFNEGITDRRLKVNFHTLRHTFASWLAEKDVSLQIIRDLLGHKSLKTTERYAKLRPSYLKVAALGLEGDFDKVAGKTADGESTPAYLKENIELYINLSREELYELVWSQPMIRLSRQFGMSDKGLAKHCKKMRIPVPGVGYWKRVRHNIQSEIPPLPVLHDPKLQRVRLRKEDTKTEKEGSIPEDDLITAEKLPENRILVPEKLSSPHALIKSTMAALKKCELDKYGKLRPCGQQCLDIHVSPISQQRALLIMDTLIKAMEKRGMNIVVENDSNQTTHVLVTGEDIIFGLEEISRRVVHEVTPEEQNEYFFTPKFDFSPSGRLSLVIRNSLSVKKVWGDREYKKIEDCLNDFIIGIVVAAHAEKAARENQKED